MPATPPATMRDRSRMRMPSRGFMHAQRRRGGRSARDRVYLSGLQYKLVAKGGLVMLAVVPKPSDSGPIDSPAHTGRRENRIVPLYHQVEQVIRHRIATRQYGSGQQ